MFHLLLQITIKACKFRAQAIFSLLEKKLFPGLHAQFEFENFFHYCTLWVLKESIYNKNLIPRAVCAVPSAIIGGGGGGGGAEYTHIFVFCPTDFF